MLTAVEQQQLFVQWNDTQADYPQDLCIHQLFEEQCLSTTRCESQSYLKSTVNLSTVEYPS
ncbi:hypothetical protein [Nostoc commune]|uniref:hypothetical protein n=1 Tax=Nostoc commune TaxID=1178 RepID=UPI00396A247A